MGLEQPHVQGVVAVRAQEGLEEPSLVEGQEATVRTGHGITDWFQIGKGVHQGCIVTLLIKLLCRVHHAKCWAG